MLRTFADIMLRVALDVGVAKYPTGSDNTPILPTDPATLFKLRDGVDMAREEFYADFPDATFRRRVLDLVVSNAAVDYQVSSSTSLYRLPVDWMGPPQGAIVVTGGRGGEVLTTSMDRLRQAYAQVSQPTGFPTLIGIERQSEPQAGEMARWDLRCWPAPDQAYSYALRGRWRAVPIQDKMDAEPTGHGQAIAAYATSYLVSKGLVSTGVGAAAALLAKAEWKERIKMAEDKDSPRTLGTQQRPRRYRQPATAIRATNPWNP